MDERLRGWTEGYWEDRGQPLLERLIRIPAVSPAFDARWRENGHLQRMLDEVRHRAPGLEGFEACPDDGSPPALLLRNDGVGQREVLAYGHLDKQPGLDGWSRGLAAWEPATRGDRLFGRGSTDDGYAPCGTGGTIPIVELLGRRFPGATFLVTGIAGPGSNCHAPDESVNLPAVRALTACVAEVLGAAGAACAG